MLTPARMELFYAVILAGDLDRVTRLLLRHEALHLVGVREMEPWAMGWDPVQSDGSPERIRDLRKRIQALLQNCGSGGGAPGTNVEQSPGVNIEHISRRLAAVERRLNTRSKRKEVLLGQLKDQRSALERLKLLEPGDIMLAAGGRHTFLEAVLVRGKRAQRVQLEALLSSVAHTSFPLSTRDTEDVVLILALKRDLFVVEKALAAAGVSKGVIPETATGNLRKDRIALEEGIARGEDQLRSLEAHQARAAARLVPVLRKVYARVSVSAVVAEAQSYFPRTSRTCLIAGWLPRTRRDEIINSVARTVHGRCFCHGAPAQDVTAVREDREQVPVLLDNPGWLKPFEALTVNYDLPRYGAVDPTLFAAVSFLVMFGAMFGDAGQGLLLLGAGIILSRRPQPAVARAGILTAYGGAAVTLFGFLYGTFFGMENVIHPLWMKPMGHVPALIPVAIAFGVLMLSLGIVINIVNSFRSHDPVNGLFGSSGLIGGLIYGTGLILAVRCFVFKDTPASLGPPASVLAGLIFLLFLKAPFERQITRRGLLFPQGVFPYILENAIGVLEIITGYAAHTLSHIRLLAFALAHAGLFLAVFCLADMVRDAAGGGVLAAVLLVAGNVLILIFEGMIAAIQTVRLEYYEFFSKFFTGGGRAYRPLGFRTAV